MINVTVEFTEDQLRGLLAMIDHRIELHTDALNRPPHDDMDEKFAKKIAFLKRIQTALVKARYEQIDVPRYY
jgi:hypothetical protein